MKKIILILIIILVGYFVFFYNKKEAPETSNTPETSAAILTDDEVKNATYSVDEQPVAFVNGRSVVEVPNSSAIITTQYFGNTATGDLDGDTTPDTAFLITQNGAGTGTFYFVVVARNTGTGAVGTNAVFLGDRIAPQSTTIQNGKVIVSYAEHGSSQAMTDTPNVMVSKTLTVKNGVLIEESN